MTRACFALFAAVWLIAPAAAQTQEEGQLRLNIQQLEEKVRQLTGENERLTYELNQMRAAQGLPPLAANLGMGEPDQTGTVTPVPNDQVGTVGTIQPPVDATLVPPGGQQDVATLGTPQPPVGEDLNGAPIDLGTLASGNAQIVAPAPGATGVEVAPDGTVQTAVIPVVPPPTTALSGSPRDEYDLAYGYILTGDYNLAEESFKTWLVSFPSDPLASDAEFWLGESHLQQGEFREAATAFLGVYKMAPEGPKGADALLKLGMSLSALGEKSTACSTFAELGKHNPPPSESIMSRARDEAARAGC